MKAPNSPHLIQHIDLKEQLRLLELTTGVDPWLGLEVVNEGSAAKLHG
jgi:hypothetical protein